MPFDFFEPAPDPGFKAVDRLAFGNFLDIQYRRQIAFLQLDVVDEILRLDQ